MSDEKNYIGIDVSKDTLQTASQDAGGHWKDCKITNTIEAINEWLDTAPSNSFFVFEYTGTYSCRLAYCLSLREADFAVLTSNQSSGFFKTLKSTSKTDKADARNLYLFGVKMKPEATQLPDEELHHKKMKFKYLTRLKDDLSAYENRLHALGFDPRADASVKQSIENIILCFQTQIDALEEEIFKEDGNEPDFAQIEKMMTTVKGIGKVSAAAIILATGGLKNFDSPKALAKFLGVCPSNKESGNYKGKGSIPKSGNGFVLKTLYVAAHSAIRFNKVCKELYDRLRAKGKSHKVAAIAVVHKLVQQAFVVVKTNTPFDNNFNVAK